MSHSLRGFVAQQILFDAPELVRRAVLAGTGPAGGTGIDCVGVVSWPLIAKGMVTFRDPKTYLFFTSSASGKRAASAFLTRLKERTHDRDKSVSPKVFLRQLKAIKSWGTQAPQALDAVGIPVLIANGDQGVMVPSDNSTDMARRIVEADRRGLAPAGQPLQHLGCEIGHPHVGVVYSKRKKPRAGMGRGAGSGAGFGSVSELTVSAKPRGQASA